MVRRASDMQSAVKKGALFAFVALMLSACVGWPSSADKSGLPSHQIGGYCTRLGNAKDYRAPHGVIVSVRPGKRKLDATILLDIKILVPAGVTLSIENPEVRLTSSNWSREQRLSIDHFIDLTDVRHPAIGPLRSPDNTGAPPGIFTASFFPDGTTEASRTDIGQVPEFTLHLPTLEINGAVFEPVAVKFHAYRRMGLFSCKP
ncbi:MAG: hypothetical protein L6Q83_07860 [Gammaproteobacteria bacterium]|nr:hypothetical protein [Gammaproteobacteria bacterium]